jgi:hypothetical protein
MNQNEQSKLRAFIREKLGLHKRASIKQMIKEIDSPIVNEKNFYKQMLRFKKAEDKYLEKREIEKQRIEREQRMVQAIQAEKDKIKIKKETKTEKDKNLVIDIKGKIGEKSFNSFKNQIIKKYKSFKGTFYFQLTLKNKKDKKIVVEELVNLTPMGGLSFFWSVIFPLIKEKDSSKAEDALIAKSEIYEKYRFVIYKSDNIPSEKLVQSFRDGEFHCVLQPLITLWEKTEKNSESESSRKRCGQIVRKLQKCLIEYADGVPQNKMDEIAKIANRCVTIHDIVGNETTSYNNKSNKTLHFTNTRVNHIDAGFITFNKQYENVSQEELTKIIMEASFCLIGGDIENPQSCRTNKGAYAVYNEKYELFQEFSNSIGIKNYGINAVKNPLLNEFLKESRIINSAPISLCDKPNQEHKDIKHADLVSAYTQHSNCPFYQGFLGKIHQFVKINASKEFIKKNLGVYKFKVLKNENEILNKLGIHENKIYTLPSPEILYFISLGVKIETICGAWGSTFHFEYTDEMLADRNYCIWAGKQGADSDSETYSFKGNQKWASHLKAEMGDSNVFYFSSKKLIVIKVLKKSYQTRHHILGFITAYTRINMLELMSKIDGQLIKVILDGIYYIGKIEETTMKYKDKEVKRHLGFGDFWYHESETETDGLVQFDERFNGNCILAGAGGTGKTYSVYDYKGFIDVLYCVPNHMLGQGQKEKYTTIHRLIGEGCDAYRNKIGLPSVILIDELTQISSSWINRAIGMYPECQFLIAGDIDEKGRWFQTRTGHIGKFNEIWKPTKDFSFIYYNNDYRSFDNELKSFKEKIREEMRRIFTGTDKDVKAMTDYALGNVPTISFNEAVKQTKQNDLWLAGTHRTGEKLKDNGILCKFGEKEKPCFTIHEFQGQTIKDRKVFIKLDLFEYAMFYTAVSRVRNFIQLVFVR